jgi:hypothetical protein
LNLATLARHEWFDFHPTKGRITAVSTIKISATLDAERVAEAKRRVGGRGFSRFLDESLAMRLQAARLEDLEADLSSEFGPIPEEARRRIGAVEWPQ